MKRAKIAAVAVLLTVSLAPMLMFAHLGSHSRPMSDDYCQIPTAASLNLLDYLIYWRAKVYGSFSDNVLRSLLSPLGTDVTSIFPAMLIGAWFFSTAVLFVKCLKMMSIQRHRLVIALILSALLVSAISSGLYSKMALYWYAASVKYSAPMVALTWFLLLLLHMAERPIAMPRRALLTVTGALLCFAIAGFAETLSMVLLIALSLLIVTLMAPGRRLWRRCRAILIASWFATVASILIMVTAPGVATRIPLERSWRPEFASLTFEAKLSNAGNVWFERVTDPAVFAGFCLMLAAGLFFSLALAKPANDVESAPRPFARAPLLFGLAAQLLCLPLVWLHTSNDASVFGRFSAAYFAVNVCNAALIVGFALALWQRARFSAILSGREHVLPAVALPFIFALFALAHFRDMHWRAYLYLWINCHSLLFALAWLLALRLPHKRAREFVIGAGCLYATNWAAIAAIALTGQLVSGQDFTRSFTFAAHLGVWQGLAWGAILGYLIRTENTAAAGRACRRLQYVALLLALILHGGIFSDQLAVLPKFQRFAIEYDVRHASILAQREAGERRIIVAPLSYDLELELRVSPIHRQSCPLEFYDVEDIELAAP